MFPFGGFFVFDPSEEIDLPASDSVFDSNVGAGTVKAGVSVRRDGTLKKLQGASAIDQGNSRWMESGSRTSTIGDLYEVQALFVSGDTLNAGSAALSTWLTISESRDFYLESSVGSVNETTNITVQVREIADPSNITVLSAWQFNIDQEP